MGRTLPILMLLVGGVVAWMVLGIGAASDNPIQTNTHDHEHKLVDSNAADTGPHLATLHGKTPAPLRVSDEVPESVEEEVPVKLLAALVRSFEARVVNLNKRIAEGVAVTARQISSGQRSVATTDEFGQFALDLHVGRYDLIFESETQGALVVRDVMHGEPLDDERVYVLGSYACLRIVVTRGAKPVKDARIYVTRHRRPGSPRSHKNQQDGREPESLREEIKTDAEGAAIVKGLAADHYDIVVRAELGSEEASTRSSQRTTRWVEREETVLFRFPESRVVTGSVRAQEANGQGPRVAATLKITQANWGTLPPIETYVSVSTLEDFSIDLPKARVDSIRVEADGSSSANIFHDHREAITTINGILWHDEDDRLDIVLCKGNSVTGHAYWIDDTPAKWIGFSFRSAPHRVVVTKRDGSYSIRGLGAGRQGVRLHTPRVFLDPNSKASVLFARGAVGMAQVLDIYLIRARTIRGVVDGLDGTPQQGARVWLDGSSAHFDGNSRNVTYTDSKGRFSLQNVHPKVEVTLRASLGDVEALPLVVDEDHPEDKTLRLTLEETGTFRGTVKDQHGKPVSGATVRFRPMSLTNGRVPLTTTTNVKGEYVVKGVLEGHWRARVSRANYYGGHTQPRAEMPRGRRTVRLDLKLSARLTLSGHVMDSKNRPLRNVRVVARNPRRTVVSIALTDAEGAFQLKGLYSMAGSFQLRCSKNNYKPLVRVWRERKSTSKGAKRPKPLLLRMSKLQD